MQAYHIRGSLHRQSELSRVLILTRTQHLALSMICQVIEVVSNTTPPLMRDALLRAAGGSSGLTQLVGV